MGRNRVVFLGTVAVLVLVVGGTTAYLIATPDAKTSEAVELFDAPRAGDGALCFRTNGGDGEFLASVDASDPDHTVRYYRSSNQVTRIDHYASNDTRVLVYDFFGDRGESSYRSRLERLRDDPNVSVDADDAALRIRAVERNVSEPFPVGGGSMLLVPTLSTFGWERVNETAYRPVGGYVRNSGVAGSNTTNYVDSVEGVVRTDGNGSIRWVAVEYTVVRRVENTFEPLFRDGSRGRITFERSVCRPDAAGSTAGS